MDDFLDYGEEEDTASPPAKVKPESPPPAAEAPLTEPITVSHIQNGDSKELLNASQTQSGDSKEPVTISHTQNGDSKEPVNLSHTQSGNSPSLSSSAWGQFVQKKEPQFTELATVLSSVKEKRQSLESISSDLKATPTEGPCIGVKGSSTLMVTDVPTNLCIPQKLENHFARYGKILNIDCQERQAFIRFDRPSFATRAFVNSSAVFKMTFIKVFRVLDHKPEDRSTALDGMLPAPNRVVSEEPTEMPLEAVTGTSLYSNIQVKSATMSAATTTTTTTTEAPVVSSGEKRTWSRAGLANMNDKDVLKSKIKEKQALQQVATARSQVSELMVQLTKQREQLTELGKDSKSVGKQFKQELLTEIQLLMVQLRHAQAAMVSAKTSVANAKKMLEIAVEKSKTEIPASVLN